MTQDLKKRRAFLKAMGAAAGSLAVEACFEAPQSLNASADQGSLVHVDARAFVSQADVIYLSPAEAPMEGLPVGNGKMGTLVWTTQKTVEFQINRNDVFASDKNHAGHMYGPTDYCGGCARVSIDVGGRPFQAGEAFRQHLSLYDAEYSVAGDGVRVRCFVSSLCDVLVLQVDDQRPEPEKLCVTVSMWRAPEVNTTLKLYPAMVVTTGTHLARYDFRDHQDKVCVVQQFKERYYRCASAVATQVLGSLTKIEVPSERARTIVVPAKNGKTTILISSAASASWPPREEDVEATAVQLLNEAATRPYEVLREEHKRWWSDYWSRTFMHISSPDEVAAFMERVRILYLYYMGSTGRGLLPAKFNGMLFSTNGDNRWWGMQCWVWTTEMLYWPLYAADAIDLTEPYFRMYVKQLPACEKAAMQRWGVGGTFFPETTHPEGPVVLPDDAAREFREVFLGRKPPHTLSEKTRALCQYDSHLFYMTVSDGEARGEARRSSPIGHIASSGSEIAVQAWWRYRYSGDQRWLRQNAYPLLRGTVEFYRHLAKKASDGFYHIYGTNVHEQFRLVNDGIMDLAAIRGTVPLAIRASEVLGVDADLRAKWQELLGNLRPYPMGSDQESKGLIGSVLASNVWAAAHLGDVNEQFGREDVWLNPVFPFEDWTGETREPEVDKIVQKLIDLAPMYRGMMEGRRNNDANRTGIAAARAGRGEDLPATLAAFYAAFKADPGFQIPVLPNGLSLFEKMTAESVEHLGLITMILQEGVLQSVSARPGEQEVISLFPAWPKRWEASFRLLSRGGFLITSSIRDGQVEFIEIESRLGEGCRLRNPWNKRCRVTEAGGGSRMLEGAVLHLQTTKGKRYRVLPEGGAEPAACSVSPKPATEPVRYSFKLPNGSIVSGVIGRHKQEVQKQLIENEERFLREEHKKWKW